MAKAKKKPRGKPFKPGNKAAKGKGRPSLPPEVKAAKKLTRAALEELLHRYVHMTKLELAARKKAEDASQLELMVIGIIEAGAKWGDSHRLNFLLDRLVGKVAEPVDITHRLGKLTRDELLAAGEEAIAFLRKQREGA